MGQACDTGLPRPDRSLTRAKNLICSSDLSGSTTVSTNEPGTDELGLPACIGGSTGIASGRQSASDKHPINTR